MCGIAGSTVDLLNNPRSDIKNMTEVLKHRGPDAQGFYVDKDVAFGHARLSIIDLSENANQPFLNEDKRYIIVFNGEIYNYQDLKKKLIQKGYKFKTNSDTEVLLNLYIDKGKECLNYLRGMFAFSIWDTKNKTMFLAVDRVGKKPLYYYYRNGSICFASELKALMQISGVSFEIDPTALADYFTYAYIPYPKTIYKNIFKLKPGYFLFFENGKIEETQYWDVEFSKSLKISKNQILEELYELLNESTRYRMISDVPLGAFLSGGIDSSVIVGLMSKNSNTSVKTCTIGFRESSFDESVIAKKTSVHFNTDHHEYFVDQVNLNEIRKLIWHFDEPFADSSFIPTFHVSRLARNIVTVALSGDGGDENFAGYQKYVVDQRENFFRMFIPTFFLRTLERLFNSDRSVIAKKIRTLSLALQQDPATAFFSTNSVISKEYYNKLFSGEMLKKIKEYKPEDNTIKYYMSANTDDHLSRILYTDIKTYLPGDILVKTDRMSMANSLELRSPILDHKVIEFAAKIPSSLKLNRKGKKYIFKEAFRDLLPEHLFRVKKHGFEIPLRKILIERIQPLVEEYIFKKKYMLIYFNITFLKNYWDSFCSNSLYDGYLIWQVLIFSIWYELFIEKNTKKSVPNV